MAEGRGSVARLSALTGLRFIAATMILVHHASVFKLSLPQLSYGHGVSLFFVLSGFILAYVYPELPTRNEVKRFLCLRVARIWPAHVAALVLVLIVGARAEPHIFLANVAMVHAWVPLSQWHFSLNSLSWSISTEFFFYLAFPLLILGWSRSFWWKWLLACFLVVALCILASRLRLPFNFTPENVVTAHGLLYINPLARLLEFVSGMIAFSCFAWLRPRVSLLVDHHPRWMFAIATGAEVLVILLVLHFLTKTPVTGFLLQHLGPGAWQQWAGHAAEFPAFLPVLIVLGFGLGGVSFLLSTRAAIFLGEISYSVYLLHQIVFNTYLRIWPAGRGSYISLVICVSVTIVMAAIVWGMIENPCRALIKKAVAPRLLRGSEVVATA